MLCEKHILQSAKIVKQSSERTKEGSRYIFMIKVEQNFSILLIHTLDNYVLLTVFFFQGIADCWDLQLRMAGLIVARRQPKCVYCGLWWCGVV